MFLSTTASSECKTYEHIAGQVSVNLATSQAHVHVATNSDRSGRTNVYLALDLANTAGKAGFPSSVLWQRAIKKTRVELEVTNLKVCS